MLTIQVHKAAAVVRDVRIEITEELDLHREMSEVDRDIAEDANALLMALQHLPSATFIKLTSQIMAYCFDQGFPQR